MKEDLSIAVSGAIERVIPTDLPNYPFIAYDSRSLVTGLSGSFDSRDNADAPRSGVRAVLGATYARKTINGPQRFIDSTTPISQALHSLAVDAAAYHTLFGTSLVGMLAIHGRSIATSDGLLDESDMFRLGGFRSIRGYREGELLASRYGYGSAEVRVRTDRRSFFFGFLDGGVLVKDSSISSREEQVHYPVSYGLGTQLESPLGLITVSIALPNGEPVDQAKLHFGLVKQF
jgi:outer membrane protein assembly factor BamA